jgi:hypothetical protein
MKKSIVACIIAGVMSTLSVQVNAKGNIYDEVIKHSTKELMIMSRILKNYILIQMHNQYQNPQEKIKDKLKKFNAEQKVLMTLKVNQELKGELQKQEKLWREAEAFIMHHSGSATLKEFKKYFIPLRDHVQNIVKNAQKKSARKYEESVLYAGKLFILPQRLATFYLLQGPESKHPEKMKKQMQKEIANYETYLSKLDAIADSFSPKVQNEIKQMHKNLRYFQYLGGSVNTFVPALAYRKTDRMSAKAKKLMLMLTDR